MQKIILNIYTQSFLVLLIAICLKIPYLTLRDLCLDEPFSVFYAQQSISTIITDLIQGNNPPLYEVILHFWIKIGGNGTGWVRFLSLIFHGGTAALVFLLSKKYFGNMAAWLSVGIFLCSMYQFFWAIEARTYSFVSMLTALSLWAFLHLAQHTHRKALFQIILLISNILLVYAHYFGWFVVFCQVFSMLFFINNKSFIKIMCWQFAILFLSYAPLWYIFYDRLGSTVKSGTWLSLPYNNQYFAELHYFFNSPQIAAGLFVMIAVVFVSILWQLLPTATQPRSHAATQPRTFTVVFLWFFVPYTLMFALSYWVIPMFFNRYILFSFVPLVIVCGAALAMCAQFLLGKIAGIGWAIAAGVVCIMYQNLVVFPTDFNHREVAKATDHIKKFVAKNPNATIITYPVWDKFTFAYHYARPIFTNSTPQNIDVNLATARVFGVGSHSAAQIHYNKNGGSIVLFQSAGQDGETAAMTPNNNEYTMKDSVFFGQCFFVKSYIQK